MTLGSTEYDGHHTGHEGQHPRAASFPMAASAQAFGKTIIVGEHAVVYGAKAVAMPVFSANMQVNLTPRRATPGVSSAHHIHVTLGGRNVSEHLRGIVEDAFTCIGRAPFDLDLDGHSSVLVGAGLGSSASLCVVVLRALAQSIGLKLTKKTLADMANQLEKRFHGNPSGLDTAVVAWEEVITFKRGDTPIPLPVQTPRGGHWRFAVLDSGARSSTLEMVQKAAPFFKGADGARHIQRFDDLASLVCQGLAEGDISTVAGAMDEVGTHLKAAGIVSQPLADLVRIAQEYGALAAKVTGAGGGGCVLALLDPAHSAVQLASLKSKLGPHRVFDVELS